MFKEILATYLFTKLIGNERARKLSIMLQKYTIKSSAIFLGFFSIAHSIRVVFSIDINIMGSIIPIWVSVVLAIVTGYFSFSLWKLR